MKNKTVSKVSLHQAKQLFLQQSLNIAEGKLLQQQIGHTIYRVQRTMTIVFIITWTFLLKIGQICPNKQCASFMCLQYFKSEGNR